MNALQRFARLVLLLVLALLGMAIIVVFMGAVDINLEAFWYAVLGTVFGVGMGAISAVFSGLVGQ